MEILSIEVIQFNFSFPHWKSLAPNFGRVGCTENQNNFSLYCGILLLHKCTLWNTFLRIPGNSIPCKRTGPRFTRLMFGWSFPIKGENSCWSFVDVYILLLNFNPSNRKALLWIPRKSILTKWMGLDSFTCLSLDVELYILGKLGWNGTLSILAKWSLSFTTVDLLEEWS